MRRSRCCAPSASTAPFYAPITTVEYARYAAQTPDHFSFVVKAPALVCDAGHARRGGAREGAQPALPRSGDRAREFVVPCSGGARPKAGPLVFQVSPLPRSLVEEAATLIEHMAAFFAALPRQLGNSSRSMPWSCAMPSC
jgi:uncharacterized protein YecE (DUF72 family)